MSEVSFVMGEPTAALRGAVGSYAGYVERADSVLVRREMAGSRCVLIFGWGAPIDVVDARGPANGASGVASFTAGLADSYVETRTAGTASGIQLDLDPLVAARLLGRPLGELANHVVGVDQLDGAGLRELRQLPERLGAAGGWPERFALLDRALAGRLERSAPPDPRVDWFWRRLHEAHGDMAVESLAGEIGWSRRHLATVSRRELGLAPKTLVRILRFERARAQTSRAAVQGWAAVAADCGYYDQAHLIRDFRQFAGHTPAAPVNA